MMNDQHMTYSLEIEPKAKTKQVKNRIVQQKTYMHIFCISKEEAFNLLSYHTKYDKIFLKSFA